MLTARVGRNRQRTKIRTWIARVLLGCVSVLVVTVLALAAVGYQLFQRPHEDPLRHADAIVVLGGEHDGREQYALKLAAEGYASTIVVSDPYNNEDFYRAGRPLMRKVCGSSTPTLTVICFQPEPSTTRGEAMFVQELAARNSWRTIIVISWEYHLVRARYIFGQCFDGSVVMRSVPRDYSRSVGEWAYQYSYQYGGLAKSAILGCDDPGRRQAG